ncbi:MAG: hypothetical protein ACJ766_19960 [Thermoleophilaceae bacterium]
MRATDTAGNTDPSPASQTWTVTAPPPTTTKPKRPRHRTTARLRLYLAATLSRNSAAGRNVLHLVGSVPASKRSQVRKVRIQAFIGGHWSTVVVTSSRKGRFSVRWRVHSARSGRLRVRAVARGVKSSKALSLRLRH